MTLIPLKVSVKRPVTSAFSSLLFLKIGLIYPKDFSEITANKDIGTSTNKVSQIFTEIRMENETITVNEPPISWTNPVPMIFLNGMLSTLRT